MRRGLAPDGELLIGYVGQLAPEKEVEHLAELAALPVVVPRAGGPLDLVEDGVNGYFFDPSREGSLRAQVCRVLASERHRADLGRRGLERVSDRTWASVVARLVDHYDRVLTGP